MVCFPSIDEAARENEIDIPDTQPRGSKILHAFCPTDGNWRASRAGAQDRAQRKRIEMGPGPYAAERALRGGTLPSLDDWRHRCTNKTMLHVLMAPKTGSEYLGSYLRHACGRDRVQTHLHGTTYCNASACSSRCSIATLREPCARVVSQFDHMRRTYQLFHTVRCRGNRTHFYDPGTRMPSAHCHQHWLHTSFTVDEYVRRLDQHWDQVLRYDLRFPRCVGAA